MHTAILIMLLSLLHAPLIIHTLNIARKMIPGTKSGKHSIQVFTFDLIMISSLALILEMMTALGCVFCLCYVLAEGITGVGKTQLAILIS